MPDETQELVDDFDSLSPHDQAGIMLVMRQKNRRAERLKKTQVQRPMALQNLVVVVFVVFVSAVLFAPSTLPVISQPGSPTLQSPAHTPLPATATNFPSSPTLRPTNTATLAPTDTHVFVPTQTQTLGPNAMATRRIFFTNTPALVPTLAPTFALVNEVAPTNTAVPYVAPSATPIPLSPLTVTPLPLLTATNTMTPTATLVPTLLPSDGTAPPYSSGAPGNAP